MIDMNRSKSFDYQTYVLFFLWTIGLISTFVRLVVGERIELTPIILAIALIDIFFNLGKTNGTFNKFSYQVLSLILIFYGWLIFSNVYSPSMEFKYEKTISFVANIIFFIYPFFIKRINFDLLIRLYCIIVLPMSAYFVYMNSILWSIRSAQTELFMEIRGTYLTFGMHLGILFLMLLYHKKNIILKILTFSLLVATSARGPLIFLLLVIGLNYLADRKTSLFNPKAILRSIGVLVGLIALYFFKRDTINSLLESSFSRFGSLAGGEDASALERVHRLSFAFYQPFEDLATFIFGNGIGSFGILFEKMDKRSYPHNILLECFFELGIIGLILFIILFVVVSRKLSFKQNVFGLLFLFTFLNAMKSNSMSDIWILFGTMGGIVAMHAKLLNYKNLKIDHKKDLKI